jgi:hypothetical protein
MGGTRANPRHEEHPLCGVLCSLRDNDLGPLFGMFYQASCGFLDVPVALRQPARRKELGRLQRCMDQVRFLVTVPGGF